MVWYSHLFQNFPQLIVIHAVKGFGIVNKAEIDVFLELSCFFDDPEDVGNLISGSSAFSKTREVLLEGERKRYTQLNAEFQRTAGRDKKAFFNEKSKLIEENNRKGKTKDIIKKSGNIKGTFHPKMDTIKDKNDKVCIEAEEIKRRWKEYTELYKKIS